MLDLIWARTPTTTRESIVVFLDDTSTHLLRYIIKKSREPPSPEGPNTQHARRKSIARKGSNAWRDSRRRESIARRASMPLGGMRIITTGGVTAGLDASLYLVGSLASHDSALEVARVMQYTWVKGVTVDAIDV